LNACKQFGSANICLSIETAKDINDNVYYCYTNSGRDVSRKNVIDWIKEVQQLGVGEIMLTSIEKEGMMSGFDINLIETISESVLVPLVMHGGAGSYNDILQILKYDKVSAVAISSLLHYSALQEKDFQISPKKSRQYYVFGF
jgi:cyclase